MTRHIEIKTSRAKPLDLFAYGSQVQGTITLKNPGKEKLRVKTVGIEGSKILRAGGQALTEIPLRTRLQPGEVQKCSLEFTVDPATPPGTYEGTFDFGESVTHPFVLHVLERTELSVFPSRIVVRGVPGRQLLKEVIMSNVGNVPVTLDEEVIMMMYEVDELNRAIGSSLAEVSEGGFNSVMDTLVVKLKEAMVRPMSIKFKAQDVTLKPGDTRKFSLSMRVPTNLKPKRSYRGRVDIFNCQLTVLLHCAKENGEVK